HVADRAEVLRLATDVVASNTRLDLVGKPLLLLDVPLRAEREAALVAALAGRASCVLFTIPAGDDRTFRSITGASILELVDDDQPPRTALARLQAGLFSKTAAPGSTEKDVIILS